MARWKKPRPSGRWKHCTGWVRPGSCRPGPGVRWRYVCEVEDREQGRAVVERLKQRPEYWNFDYPREELDRASVRRPLRSNAKPVSGDADLRVARIPL